MHEEQRHAQFQASILPSESEPLRPAYSYISQAPLQKTRSCKEVEDVNFDEDDEEDEGNN